MYSLMYSLMYVYIITYYCIYYIAVMYNVWKDCLCLEVPQDMIVFCYLGGFIKNQFATVDSSIPAEVFGALACGCLWLHWASQEPRQGGAARPGFVPRPVDPRPLHEASEAERGATGRLRVDHCRLSRWMGVTKQVSRKSTDYLVVLFGHWYLLVIFKCSLAKSPLLNMCLLPSASETFGETAIIMSGWYG